MLMFMELTKEAKKTAINKFIEEAKAVFDFSDDHFDPHLIEEFLSRSKVHRFNESGILIGKMVQIQGKESFKPDNIY